MDPRTAIAWLSRTAGFGADESEFAAALERGAPAELERQLALPLSADPWDDARLPADPRDQAARMYAIDGWATLMATSSSPLRDRIAWWWHGHFVSALDKVRTARAMVVQARLFRSEGLGEFRSLVRAVTIDPAMLVYLDGRTSTGAAPNENYARELMELFALGVGNFGEDDVAAAAAALTGWTVGPDGAARFRPRRHDDTPRSLLGAEGVHDLDTVVDAVLGRAEFATFVTARMCRSLLGTAPPDLVTSLAGSFGTDRSLTALVRGVLTAGLDGVRSPIVLEPARWLASAERVTGVRLEPRERLTGLRAAGQLPFVPPNVAGWPGGAAWCSAAAVVARARLATTVASRVDPAHPVSVAADTGPDELAAALGLGDAFGPTTSRVLRSAPDLPTRISLALSSPEYLLV